MNLSASRSAKARTRLLATITLAKLALAVPTLVGCSLALPPVRAEAPDTAPKPVTLDFRNVPVRAALRALFQASGSPSYEVDPDVRGLASAEATAAPFETALRQIADSVQPPLDFTAEGGSYRISVKRAAPQPAPAIEMKVTSPGADGLGAQPQTVMGGGSARPQRFYHIPINSYDASVIAGLLNAQGITKVGINEVVPAGAAGAGQTGGQSGGSPAGGFGGGGRGGGRQTGY